MIVGIGLDLIDFDHFRKFYVIDDVETLKRCFTDQELDDVNGSTDPLDKLAARMAAKEAVLKVLGGLQQGTAWTDIEIRSTDGAPKICLMGGASARASSLEISSWHLSMTHSATSAAAVALAIR